MQVASEVCGTCVTLQFRRVKWVEGLAPAKLTVYPSLALPEAKEAYKQFFHVNSLNSSIAAEDTAVWRITCWVQCADGIKLQLLRSILFWTSLVRNIGD